MDRVILRGVKRTALAAGLVCLVAALSAAPPKRDPDIEALVERARTLPQEFAIDLLLRFAVSPKIVDHDWKRELVEDAWNRTYFIREPYRQMAAAPPVDTREAARSQGYDMRFDRLTLQTRAVRAMLPWSRTRAREMFEWIDFELRPSTCLDPLVPSLDDYFDTLAIMARSAFGASDDERAEALFFLEIYAWRASRPSEIASLARALTRFKPTGDEAQHFESVIGWILDRSERAPREFAIFGDDVTSKFAELDDLDRRAGVTGGALLRGLRRYLVSQASGPRCSDSLTEGRAIAGFNYLAQQRALAVTGLTPIAPSENRPQRMSDPVRYEYLWQTAESKGFRDEAAELSGKPGAPTSVRTKREKVWQDRAERFLVDLEHWVGTRETERDFLYEKALLLTGLTEILPDGALRTRALRSSVNFLRSSAGRGQPGEWFSHVRRLMDLAQRGYREPVFDALETSNDPVMSAYARAERLQPAQRATR